MGQEKVKNYGPRVIELVKSVRPHSVIDNNNWLILLALGVSDRYALTVPFSLSGIEAHWQSGILGYKEKVLATFLFLLLPVFTYKFHKTASRR